MKKFLLITLDVIFAILIASVIIFIISLLKDDQHPRNIYKIFSEDLIKNGNFRKKIKYWHFDKNSITTNIGNQIYACISNKSTTQNRIWQDINVISGQIYHLTFEVYGQQEGAFAIYRDIKTGKEKYLLCSGKSGEKTYVWDIKPNNTGKSSIFLSTNKPGKYYFTNINLKLYSIKVICKKLFLLLIIVLILLSLFHNRIFVLIILPLLIFPIIKISNEKKSINENRNLSVFKPLILKVKDEHKINTNFGRNFNDWLNDHFWGRKWIITQNEKIKFLIDRRRENELAFQGENGWLFNKHVYYDKNYISNCEKIKDNIDRLTDYYSKKGIKIYFVIMPEKECQYSENHCVKKFEHEKIPEYLSTISTNNFAYLKDDIEKLKYIGYTHFKEDHHWTHLGAFGGYQRIMKMISKDFDVSILSKDDFTIENFSGAYDNQAKIRVFQNNKKVGSTYGILKLDNESYEYDNNYLTFIPKQMPKFIKSIERGGIYEGGTNDLKIVVIGDSNIGYIVPFITSSFSKSLFLYASGLSNYKLDWSIKDYDDIIFDFNPQIIVVLVRAVSSALWINLN